jgi:Flp pilus assembly pilin Flp
LTEYGILLGLIAVVAIGAVSSLGQEAKDTFESSRLALAASGSAPAPENNFSGQIENQVTFTAGRYSWTSNHSDGWQSVNPTYGTGSQDVGPNHTLVGVFTTNDTGQLTVKFLGDQTGIDTTGYRIACLSDLNPVGWERDLPPFDEYITTGQNTSAFVSAAGYVPNFQAGDNVSCTITSPSD